MAPPTDHEEADPTDSHVSQSELARSKIYSSLKELFSTYWVLVVIGAFLLVFLTGTPSLLKTIYLIFFFVFLVTYQVRLKIVEEKRLNCRRGWG